ncbi:MAG: hypothetical protein BM557_06045 [Flavobacterium sp. MedPE-SWcel]|nr:MAG: hypothetical protein BM557_06045 [Flavobacterium sp. MedPE-SWcel]
MKARNIDVSLYFPVIIITNNVSNDNAKYLFAVLLKKGDMIRERLRKSPKEKLEIIIKSIIVIPSV